VRLLVGAAHIHITGYLRSREIEKKGTGRGKKTGAKAKARACGSRRYWFDGQVRQCCNCVPPPSPDEIRVDIKEKPN
jgi:hypothetical protein